MNKLIARLLCLFLLVLVNLYEISIACLLSLGTFIILNNLDVSSSVLISSFISVLLLVYFRFGSVFKKFLFRKVMKNYEHK